jgi:hypothetical protein
VALPVAGIVGGAVQVGRGLANQKEAIEEKRKGKIWDKVGHPGECGCVPCVVWVLGYACLLRGYSRVCSSAGGCASLW